MEFKVASILATVLFGITIAQAAYIGTPIYSVVSDAATTNYDLSVTGTQDWQIYDGSLSAVTEKQNGTSISLSTPVTVVPPCVTETLGSAAIRSHATFSWTAGTPTSAATAYNPNDAGFKFSGTNATVAAGTNFEQYTFVPGDTNLHTVNLYGYAANNALLNLQFTASLAGVATPVTTNPPAALGDFDYSVTFQADHTNDALTVVFTFSKTSTATTLATAGINAAALTGTPPVNPVNWRVIADDTNFPTSDTVMAGVVFGDSNFGTPPTNSATTDCSAYVQAAMNFLSTNGGGTVFLPAGHYMFTNQLWIPNGVILRGRWAQPIAGQPLTNGTFLDIYANSNQFLSAGYGDTLAFIQGPGNDIGVRDLTFWYPNQNPTNPVSYPYTLVNSGGAGSGDLKCIENITLVNSYAGMDLSKCSFQCLRGVYGTPLTTGLYIDKGNATPRFDTVSFSPNYWAGSGLPGAPTNAITQAALASYIMTNSASVGMDIREVDGAYIQNIMLSGYNYGIRFGFGLFDNAGNPQFYNVTATNCVQAMRFEAVKGLQAFNCTFAGTTNGYGFYHTGNTNGSSCYGMDCYNCSFSGGQAAVYGDNNSPTTYAINLQGCTLGGVINLGTKSTLQLIGSTFSGTGANVILNSGVQQALIVGNTNCVLSNSSGATLVLNTNPVVPVTVPFFPTNYPKIRKPAMTNLFNVMSYGAKADGATDDSLAIKAAIAVAETNGGGIVFFPAGTYIVSSNLVVTNGVELRGIYGGRHENSNTRGSLVEIMANQGTTNAPPFIMLGDRCGIRGLNFDYPIQNWPTNLQTPYPYMIQCNGGSNYLTDICAGDVYQGIDINGAKAALVEYCFLGGLRNTYYVHNGASDCRLQNLHVKPPNWWLNTNSPPTGDGPSITIAHNIDTFIAADCTNLTIFSIFNHCAHTLFTLRGGTGQAMMLAGEELQRGYVLQTSATNGSFTFIGCGCNVSSPGDGTGEYGFWLQTNFSGTVSTLAQNISDTGVDYDLREDYAGAQLFMNDLSTGQGRGLCNIRAAGVVAINNSSLSERFTLDVPTGGQFICSNSYLPMMSYSAQSGYLNWGTTNNNVIPNSYIAADLNESPYRPAGITLVTNNLAPLAVDAFPTVGASRNPTIRIVNGWHLTNGNTNFKFYVTNSAYAKSAKPSVTIEVFYLEDTDGSLTVQYDSASGLKSGPTYLLSSTNAAWRDQSFNVSDARFSGTNVADILITVSNAPNCDPVVLYALVSSSYLGVPTQLLPPPPVAVFAATPTNGIRPLAVSFTDGSAGTITNLFWSFGDSQTTNTPAGAVVAHTYSSAGTYTVSLKAGGPGGSATNTQSGVVTVRVPNPPQITGISPAGATALVLQGVGGPTNSGYFYWLRSSTNLTLPLTNWNIVATNPFDAYGNFSNQIPLMPGVPQSFYRLQMP